MLMKYFFLCVCSASLTKFALSDSGMNCSLSIQNKNEFEDQIFDYLDEDSKILIIEYNLDFSGVGNDFNILNRTNPNALQPLRWYRTKGTIVERLMMFKNDFYFSSLMLQTFMKTKVKIIATPYGCLNSISRDNMEPFIAKFLLDDFEVNVDELRTSKKLYKNAKICTKHFEKENENATAAITFWCCWYDLHNHMTCRSQNLGSSILIVQIILMFLFLNLYWCSLWLFPKFTKPRVITYTPKTELLLHFAIEHIEKWPLLTRALHKIKRIFLQSTKLFGIHYIFRNCNCYRMKKTNRLKFLKNQQSFHPDMKEFNETLQKLRHYSICAAKVKEVYLVENKSLYIKEREKTIYGLISFIRFFLSGTNTSEQRSSSLQRLVKIIIFLVVYTLPPSLFVYYMNNDSDEKDQNQAFVDRGLSNASNINNNTTWLVVSICGPSFFCQFLLLVLIVIDDCKGIQLGKIFFEMLEKIKNSWQCIFDILKECYRECFCCILFFPIIPILFFPLIVPFILVLAPTCSGDKKGKINYIWYMIFYLCFMAIVLPGIIMSQMFIIVIALFMFKGDIIYPVLSGLIAFLINVRLLIRAMGEKHDEYLKKIFHLVNKNAEEASSSMNKNENNEQQNPCSEAPQQKPLFLFESNINANINGKKSTENTKPKVIIVCKNDCLYLTMNSSPAFICEDGVNKIKKSALLFCMRDLYVKALYVFLVIMLFMTAVVSVVFVLGRFDYISTSNQMFITLVTGIIPSLLMLGKGDNGGSSNEDSTSNQNANAHKNELKELENSLNSYSELYLINDFKVEEKEEYQNVHNLDFTVTFIKDNAINELTPLTQNV